jgi:hypothetical protein
MSWHNGNVGNVSFRKSDGGLVQCGLPNAPPSLESQHIFLLINFVEYLGLFEPALLRLSVNTSLCERTVEPRANY